MAKAAATHAASTDPVDLERLDAAVEAAVRRGEAGELRVLGYGELTLVLGWPGERPVVAVKRLPPFRDSAQLERYRTLLQRYIGELERRGVSVVPTALERAPAALRRAYLVQPLFRRRSLLNNVLRGADAGRGKALLERLVTVVAGAVDGRLGLDAQAANWVVDGERLSYLDLSTPLLRDDRGRDLLDLSIFLAAYPWALRAPLRPVARQVISQFHDPRGVLVDVASNLIKERLEGWLPALIEAAGRRVTPPIREAEVRRYFVRDRRLWLLMQRLRRADRAWQGRVRRRPYPLLLPPPYAYGPPELPEEAP
jgi:hypothetical protein